RDLLYVADAVEAYLSAWERIETVAGRAFNLGGGPDNAVSLLQVADCIERLIGRPVERSFGPWRPGDQRWYVTDGRATRAALALAPPLDWRAGLEALLDYLQESEAPATGAFPAMAGAEARQ